MASSSTGSRSGACCSSSKVEECTSTTTESESHTPKVSLLEKLKAPKRSDLTRKCTVDLNPLPKGKRLSLMGQIIENNWENNR